VEIGGGLQTHLDRFDSCSDLQKFLKCQFFEFTEVVQLADTMHLKRIWWEFKSLLRYQTLMQEYGVIGNIPVSKTEVSGSIPGTPAKVITRTVKRPLRPHNPR
jgi:hypothetical protein